MPSASIRLGAGSRLGNELVDVSLWGVFQVAAKLLLPTLFLQVRFYRFPMRCHGSRITLGSPKAGGSSEFGQRGSH